MKTYRFGFHMSNELNSYLNKNVETLSIAILKSFYFINIKPFTLITLNLNSPYIANSYVLHSHTVTWIYK